ncbi:MAG: hypothetical protein QXZ19_00945 [Thermoplasmata archaeon]
MRCQACGSENLPMASYCQMCGARLAALPPPDKSAIRDQTAALELAVSKRTATEKHIPAAVVVVIMAGVIAMNIIGVGAIMAAMFDMLLENPDYVPSEEDLYERSQNALIVLSVTSVMMYTFLGILFYSLVKRLNNHLEREGDLRSAVIELMKSSVRGSPAAQTAVPQIAYLESFDSSIRRSEVKRNPVLWGLILAVPLITSVPETVMIVNGTYGSSLATLVSGVGILVGVLWIVGSLYIIYQLGKSIYEHDFRWCEFATTARNALTTLGFPPGPMFSIRPLKRRSFPLYLLLTVLTLSLFMIYWLYVLVKDQNDHFARQWEIEDNFVASAR